MMNKQTFILLFWSLTYSTIYAQKLTVIDELGSPIRDVHLVNNDASVFAFTDKSGRAPLGSFSEKELRDTRPFLLVNAKALASLLTR